MTLNVALVEQSFKLVAPKGAKPVARFYGRLSHKYPSVRLLFRSTSMEEQKKRLASLILVIQRLRQPEELTRVLQERGASPVGYGAQPAHDDAVADTMWAV